MIVKKSWEKRVKRRTGREFQSYQKTTHDDVYTGWFLFGILPLYVMRDRTRIN